LKKKPNFQLEPRLLSAIAKKLQPGSLVEGHLPIMVFEKDLVDLSGTMMRRSKISQELLMRYSKNPKLTPAELESLSIFAAQNSS
jgi:hypothetical protein